MVTDVHRCQSEAIWDGGHDTVHVHDAAWVLVARYAYQTF
jgi:hypothetical protein